MIQTSRQYVALLVATLIASLALVPAATATAPGYRPLAYPAPEPGTYRLPSLGPAADGEVLDSSGAARSLHGLMAGKIVLLSFVYTSCGNVSGCPLATFVLGAIDGRLQRDADLRDRVRLMTLSFDPAKDTPAAMGRYRQRVIREGSDWLFLTTRSEAELAPILDSYGQAISRDRDASGRDLDSISHVLRVYLIDAEGRIRNIYSASFLHADTVMSDMRTLVLEAENPVAEQPVAATRPRAQQPAAALGLPALPMAGDAAVTDRKVALGRKLFFDRRLSGNGTISCAMCHVPEQAFTSNELATAVGIEGRAVKRNTPSLLNVGYNRKLFHDGREQRLEEQVWSPILAANEMGNRSAAEVVDRIRSLADYAGLFEDAFDGEGPSRDGVGSALASYQRTLVAGNSVFDRWRYGGDVDVLSERAQHGFALFTGSAGCADCHLIGESDALFTDHDLHDTGIGFLQSQRVRSGPKRLEIAPQVWIEIDLDAVADASEPVPADLGRYEVTGADEDRWKFKTPGLRNVALTAPYMHDGSIPDLRSVVEFYDRGGAEHELLDPRIRPLGLSAEDVEALVAFLESLTSDDVQAVIAGALPRPGGAAARVGPLDISGY